MRVLKSPQSTSGVDRLSTSISQIMLPRELQSLVSCFRKRPIFNGGRGFSNLAGPVLAKDLWTGWSSTGGAVVVPGRAFLRVFGQDALKFLQGLVTNQVNLLAGEVPAQYAAFLSPQVRFRRIGRLWPVNHTKCQLL
jgi:hypothetical protein